ncbi:MAG TPA: hypothetical protein PLU43_12180, partial [Lachnospiraceae bacterium]|nr:hypothetical protein [Lachnospiraceae bacterium]
MVDKLEKAKERDRNKIAEIRSKWNLDKIEDVEKVLGLLQTGSIWFETETGRAFDDELYDRKLKLEGGHTSSAAVRGKKKNAGAANKK